MPRQAFQFEITTGLVFQRDPLSKLIDRDRTCVVRKPQQSSLLGIDNGLGAAQVGLKSANLSGVECEP